MGWFTKLFAPRPLPPLAKPADNAVAEVIAKLALIPPEQWEPQSVRSPDGGATVQFRGCLTKVAGKRYRLNYETVNDAENSWQVYKLDVDGIELDSSHPTNQLALRDLYYSVSLTLVQKEEPARVYFAGLDEEAKKIRKLTEGL